jgi:hypothetical protein
MLGSFLDELKGNCKVFLVGLGGDFSLDFPGENGRLGSDLNNDS